MRKTHFAAIVGAIAASAALAACGSTTVVDNEKLQTDLANQTAKASGASPSDFDVSCPGDVEVKKGATFECTVTGTKTGKTFKYDITLTNDQADYKAVPHK
jgi:Domain of unknown function (DUF4333)